ncbi:MAG: hypothetical protein Q8Q30_02345 [Candidatus Woesebacteria bacterium]|nr:hypothetical protein [Candidatus Woesebacteria bacterium]
MNFSKKDVVIGFIIIAIAVSGAYLYRKLKNPEITTISNPTPISFQKDLEDSFKYDIPDGVNSIELKDVSGGNGRGIATENEVLADIEDPSSGYFYQAWIENNGNFVSLGKLQMAKGGWLLDYSNLKLDEAEKIIISLEKNYDGKIEKKILEGSFN